MVGWQPSFNGAPAKATFKFKNRARLELFVADTLAIPGVSLAGLRGGYVRHKEVKKTMNKKAVEQLSNAVTALRANGIETLSEATVFCAAAMQPLTGRLSASAKSVAPPNYPSAPCRASYGN